MKNLTILPSMFSFLKVCRIKPLMMVSVIVVIVIT